MTSKLDIRLVSAAFFALAVGLRLIPHEYNMAAVGALGMFVGCYWSARIGFLMVLAAMAVSDVAGHVLGIPSMGFYEPWLMLTVYGATGLAVLPGKVLAGLKDKPLGFLAAAVPVGAVGTTAIFFLVTNFASWLDPQMAYPRTLTGLVECYMAAIPFAKNTLVGNVLYSAMFFGSYMAMAGKLQHRPSVAK